MSQYFIHALLCGLAGALVSLGLSAFLCRRPSGAGGSGRLPDFHHCPASASIPRLGGIAIFGGFCAALGMAALVHPDIPVRSVKLWVVLGCLLGIFVLGIVDDYRRMGARWKLALQVLLAAGVWLTGTRIEQFQVPGVFGPVPLHAFGFFVTVFWLVAMTNLINLIDGIDGLAGGIGVLLMGLLAWVALGSAHGLFSLVCLGVMGALLGFLRFNFPPARIYLGDGGAYFIGFMIGVVSIETSNKGTVVAALAAPVLALAVPILDTLMALVRRGSKGLPLFRADQGHIHHRLLTQIGDKRQVLMVLYAICVLATAYALAIYLLKGRHLPLLAGVGSIVVVWVLQRLQALPKASALWPILKSHFRLRRHSRRILPLGRQLNAEVGRGMTLEHLWAHFDRLAADSGMDRIRLGVDGQERVWQNPGGVGSGESWHRRQFWGGGGAIEVEFHGTAQRLAEDEFEHIADLLAEALHRAAGAYQGGFCAQVVGDAARPSANSPLQAVSVD